MDRTSTTRASLTTRGRWLRVRGCVSSLLLDASSELIIWVTAEDPHGRPVAIALDTVRIRLGYRFPKHI